MFCLNYYIENMPSKTPLCKWSLDECLEFMIEIGAVVKNDSGYSSGWSEDMIQWSKNRVIHAIAKKCGYQSNHTRTLRSLVDRVTDEYHIVWNYQGRWIFEKTLAKEVSELTGYDVDELNLKDWHRIISYYSGLRRSQLSDEKIRERMQVYVPKVFNGIKDIRKFRINSRHARNDA